MKAELTETEEWKFVAKIEKQKISTYDGTMELKQMINKAVLAE